MWRDYYDKKCYIQTDTYGSWRDMHNLNTKKDILAQQRLDEADVPKMELPKFLKGELKALYSPKKQTDWLLSESKAYTRTIYLDHKGSISTTYMEAKWMPLKGEDQNREQFVYLLCTHLTLHLVCIGPNYWDFVWTWGPGQEATLSLHDKKDHPGAWALFADDWQKRMFGALRTCFFRPEHTWKNAIKSPGNAGTKGDITAFHGYLHMNAYPAFLVPRLQTHSPEQQKKIDMGKVSPNFIKTLFGKNIIPNVCYSTAKLVDGIQWTEGQHVCISGHRQVAWYPVDYTEKETVMPFAQHENGIRWKILAILWSSEPTKLTKIAGDTLVS